MSRYSRPAPGPSTNPFQPQTYPQYGPPIGRPQSTPGHPNPSTTPVSHYPNPSPTYAAPQPNWDNYPPGVKPWESPNAQTNPWDPGTNGVPLEGGQRENVAWEYKPARDQRPPLANPSYGSVPVEEQTSQRFGGLDELTPASTELLTPVQTQWNTVGYQATNPAPYSSSPKESPVQQAYYSPPPTEPAGYAPPAPNQPPPAVPTETKVPSPLPYPQRKSQGHYPPAAQPPATYAGNNTSGDRYAVLRELSTGEGSGWYNSNEAETREESKTGTGGYYG
jgi:hypothetical protein